MPSKKSITKKTKQSRGAKLVRFHGAPTQDNPAPPIPPPREKTQAQGAKLVRVHGGKPASPEITSGNGRRKRPYYLNPETGEEREKRLAARKALTLKAFEIAYENHHRRKAS
jgi:hypothetical protein